MHGRQLARVGRDHAASASRARDMTATRSRTRSWRAWSARYRAEPPPIIAGRAGAGPPDRRDPPVAIASSVAPGRHRRGGRRARPARRPGRHRLVGRGAARASRRPTCTSSRPRGSGSTPRALPRRRGLDQRRAGRQGRRGMTVVLVPNASVPPAPGPARSLADLVSTASPTSTRSAPAPDPACAASAAHTRGRDHSPSSPVPSTGRPASASSAASAASSVRTLFRRPRRGPRALRDGPGDLLLQPPQLEPTPSSCSRCSPAGPSTPCSGRRRPT